MAQGSYLYFEPIKGLPCKVLVNQKEVNLLSKNYCLIPFTGSGEYTIDLVFGGSLYPRQTFVVDVVEGAAYGFKLARTAENKFYLLDLVNNGKIIETNTAVNLALTTSDNTIHFFDPSSRPNATEGGDMGKRGGLFRKSKSQRSAGKEPEPLTESHPPKEQYGIVQIITSKSDGQVVSPRASVTESRCQASASDEEVNAFGTKLSQKNDDESKLILIRKKLFTGCLTCRQLLVLAEPLNTQYGRFSALKILRPLLSDPGNISQLEPLFRTDSYKSKLRELK